MINGKNFARQEMDTFKDGLIIIPARYNSSRLPGKALKDINGKTMIRRTYERCKLSGIHTIVVTDDKRIVDECLNYSIPVDIVTEECKTGTDRVARCAERNQQAKWFINVQGDEPFANVEDIIKIAKQLQSNSDEVVNAYSIISDEEKFFNTKCPKVIVHNGKLIYASRAPIPHAFNNENTFYGYEQLGMYGFYYDHLFKFISTSSKTFYENLEDIEILRFIEMNIPVRMLELEGSQLHVDTQEDLNIAIKIAHEQESNTNL
tara:strand:+ start:8694 stop:9479 length:786 start_codon:yes stop_codon:yes gene_type:complete